MKRVVNLEYLHSGLKTPALSLVSIKWRGQKILADNILGSKEWFDLDLWKYMYDLNINRDHHWGQPLQQVWYWSRKGVKRYWADNTWSTDRKTDDQPTDRQLQNNMPLFQGGQKMKGACCKGFYSEQQQKYIFAAFKIL